VKLLILNEIYLKIIQKLQHSHFKIFEKHKILNEQKVVRFRKVWTFKTNCYFEKGSKFL